MASNGGRGRVLVPVYLYTMGTWASYALVVVVLPFRFQQLGISVVAYGVALSVYALGTLATEGLWGFFAFRIGSPRLLGALGAATAVSMALLGFARSFEAFAVLLGVYGALVVYSTPLVRWLGMTLPGPDRPGQGLGALGLFFGVGLSVGTALGPVVYSIAGFETTVLVATGLFVAATVPILTVRWEVLSLPPRRGLAQSAAGVLRDRRFVLATVLVVLYFVVFTLATNFLQYYSTGLFHGTIDQAGYAIGAVRAVAVVTGVVIGRVVDRRGAHRVAPIGFLLLAAGALATWGSVSWSEMLGASLVFALGAGCLGVALLPMALARIEPSHQGTAVGVFGSFEDLGLILGPLLFGVVYASGGPRELFPVAAAVAVVAAGLASYASLERSPARRAVGGR